MGTREACQSNKFYLIKINVTSNFKIVQRLCRYIKQDFFFLKERDYIFTFFGGEGTHSRINFFAMLCVGRAVRLTCFVRVCGLAFA
jgi:hypothetical protein